MHSELCRRAGFSIDWPRTKKADYLAALTKEIESPGKDILDAYLKPFVGAALDGEALAGRMVAIKGTGWSSRRGPGIGLIRRSRSDGRLSEVRVFLRLQLRGSAERYGSRHQALIAGQPGDSDGAVAIPAALLQPWSHPLTARAWIDPAGRQRLTSSCSASGALGPGFSHRTDTGSQRPSPNLPHGDLPAAGEPWGRIRGTAGRRQRETVGLSAAYDGPAIPGDREP